jgi:phosphate transport system ATP-binding protein
MTSRGIESEQPDGIHKGVERVPGIAIQAHDLTVSYGQKLAIQDINLDIPTGQITAIVGESGSGKSTLLRAFNRMNEFKDGCKTTGQVLFHGIDIYDSSVDPVEVRRRIGMIAQKPDPFVMSIYDNVAWGIKEIRGIKKKFEVDELVIHNLQRAALWDEVKDKLTQSAFTLSGGQQQRLCIARALAMDTQMLLMDEPCSALDPGSTDKIEKLMMSLRNEGLTIVIVTHNQHQARRASDQLVYISSLDGAVTDGKRVPGKIIEVGPTVEILKQPQSSQTEAFFRGAHG